MEQDIQKLLAKYNITPDPLKDQFFLVDKEILAKIIKVAAIKPNERVLEIGPGLGIITRELAKFAKEVLAIEIDPQFKPALMSLPRNVRVVYGNALETKIKFDKLVASLPYSLCEPLMHKLVNSHFRAMILILPRKFAQKLALHPILGPLYKIKIMSAVAKAAFYPQPQTSSVLVKITRRPEHKVS